MKRKDTSNEFDNPSCHPENWVDEHASYLYQYALSRLRNHQLAEDIVQETFLSALRSRDSFAGRSSERTWLIGILKHKIIDYFRKSSRESILEDPEVLSNEWEQDFDETGRRKGHWKEDLGPVEWTADPGTIFEHQEFWEIFHRCLDALPPRLAQVFTLRELDGLSTEEICKIMNISTDNLSVMLYRARMQLRRSLEANYFRQNKGKSQKKELSYISNRE
jgi:RNA polymerase sigma-70 factor (ECF subfamily)